MLAVIKSLIGVLIAAISLVILYKKQQPLFYPIFIVLLGTFSADLLISLGGDTGIRYHNIGPLLSTTLLPILIFSGAVDFPINHIGKDVLCNIIFTVPLFFFTVLITTCIIYWATNHPTGFPVYAALLTAVLLSSTTSHSINSVLKDKSRRLPSYFSVLVKGESLMSGILSITGFYFLLDALRSKDFIGLAVYFVKDFIYCSVIGIAVGVLVGSVYIALFRAAEKKIPHQKMLNALNKPLSLLLVYSVNSLTYFLWPELSVIAIFSLGLLLKKYFWSCRLHKRGFILAFWKRLATIASIGVFFLLGVTVTANMFSKRWLSMLIGIMGIILARFFGIFSIMPLLSKLGYVARTSFKEKYLLSLAGIRGEIAIILGLAMPISLSYWWTVQSIAFGVVLFTLAIQTPILGYLLSLYESEK